jgi:cell fate regulator YaaT (PSP1 superfamily)
VAAQLVEIRFKGNRKAFYRWEEPEPLVPGEPVIVETDRGHDLGHVSATGAVATLKCERCGARVRAPQGAGEDAGALRAPAETSGAATAPEIADPPETADPPEAAAETGVAAASEAVPGAVETSTPASALAPETTSPPREPERRVVRRASVAEVKAAADLRRSEDDARRKVRERAAAFHLAMKVSDAEWQWDRNKLTVYFTAERRVDFRTLVRDLATVFRTRIELRQIGVRDESKRLDGIGRCGRQLCCTWLPELRPIGLQIAKDQSLSLNPTQISGACGRLLCCLRYEHEFYVQSRKRFPKEGKTLITARGPEKVVAVDIFRERVTLRGEEGTARTVPLAELKGEVEAAASPAAEPPGSPPPRTPPPAPTPPTASQPPAAGERKRGHRGGRRRRHRR